MEGGCSATFLLSHLVRFQAGESRVRVSHRRFSVTAVTTAVSLVRFY